MQKILNERLLRISAHISNNTKVIDIGCDHGLLGIYLALNRVNMRIVLSDIKEKPLQMAKKNIIKYHLEDKINLIQADGLAVVPDNIDTIVISGMGAITMINILQKINDYPSIKKIVLYPNNDFSYVRENMNKLGFKIISEEIIKDNGKYYLIISYQKGEEIIDNYFGKLDLDNPINKEYFLNILMKNKKILNVITDQERKDILIKENEKIINKMNY